MNTFKLLLISAVIITSVYMLAFKTELPDYVVRVVGKYQWYNNVKFKLNNKLIKERHITNTFKEGIKKDRVVIYVLGGAKNSMEYKIERVYFIKNNCLDCKILFLSEPGLAGYSRSYGRVITNNEWILKYCENYNINNSDIDFVLIETGFFGTLTEARVITEIAIKRGYKRLILVTSPYHTMRTWLSFQHFNKNNELDIYIYKDNYQVNFRYLLIEYIKFYIYNIFLLS
ncbi:MAG: ElyC/SanA/YdcF family protein [bacterium]|jgi:hypothetical protein